MDREDTWAQAVELAPRLIWRIIIIIFITVVCSSCLGFFYMLFFQGKTFTLPTVPTSTPNSNVVKSEY